MTELYDDTRTPAELADSVLGSEDRDRVTEDPQALAPGRRDAFADPNENRRLNDRLKRILDRPTWHAFQTPQQVQEAWSSVLRAVRQAGELGSRWSALDAEERRGNRDAVAAAKSAIAAGQEPPATVERIDRSGEKTATVIAYEAQIDAAAQARRLYDLAVRESVPSWRQHAADTLTESRQHAAAAFRAFDDAWDAWAAHQRGLRALNVAVERKWGTAPVSKIQDQAKHAADSGIHAIGRLLGSADAVLTGDYLAEPLDAVPPLWQRRIMAHGGANDVMRLAQIEANENYRHSSFTRDDGPSAA